MAEFRGGVRRRGLAEVGHWRCDLEVCSDLQLLPSLPSSLLPWDGQQRSFYHTISKAKDHELNPQGTISQINLSFFKAQMSSILSQR